MDSAIDLTDTNSALDLANIRYQLIRLEDTIIFHLIERVQFPYNPSVYKAGAVQIPNFNGSFLDWMLLQQEKVHAQVRRYQAPDEYPFFPDQLPEPFLAPLSYPKLLHPNNVNINEKIKDAYTTHILPPACVPAGPDRGEARENYGSTAVADVACLQAMSRRIHFGKFVAEAKFREDPEGFTKMIQEKDIQGLENAITKPAVELQVLKRLELKARTYGTDPSSPTDKQQHNCKINVEAVVAMYRDWVIPMTKEVEIDYLLQRLDPVPCSNGSAGKV
ncbi:chorismate mutase [Pyronema domesticum]|nr:chorismate mutase [Pyronema domesticum]